jgi:predicted nuclease of restriction endonuclease-like (RecB) superfamily
MNMKLDEAFISQVRGIILESKNAAIRSVDFQRVLMYWQIGEKIVLEDQQGKSRAGYGDKLIQTLAKALEPEFGSGFSQRQMERSRQFYRTFPDCEALMAQFSWTHYRLLLSIENTSKRAFYEAEASRHFWNSRELERQINSQLYERLLMSNEPANVLAIARGERQPQSAKEIIKDPLFLEFLGLRTKSEWYEKDLESAILTHMQEFLLELGNGFAFIARQKRINLNGDDFFIDLVLYNRILLCFVILEIKTKKLEHSDLGQLQMYVNYYDRHEKLPTENPTIGILLCTDKNDAVVKYSLPENQTTIHASRYEVIIPSPQQFLAEVHKEIRKIDRLEPGPSPKPSFPRNHLQRKK